MQKDEVIKIKEQLQSNIISLEKQKAKLTLDYNNKLSGINSHLANFRLKLVEVKRYKKV